VDAQCFGTELRVNDQPLNGTVLYKPTGSRGTFVTCHKCDDNINRLTWHSLNKGNKKTRLTGCEKAVDSVCSSKLKLEGRGLSFLTFTPALAGLYECRINGDIPSSINISVLG